MTNVEDLTQLVEELQARGMAAHHDFLYGRQGCLEGLDVGEDFFPLWELRLPENRAAVERLDFDEIKSRRAGDWNMAQRRTAA